MRDGNTPLTHRTAAPWSVWRFGFRAHTRAQWRAWLAAALLAAVCLAPRVTALDRIVTPDEKRWLAQSANFYQALAAWQPADTYQIEHPGVPVMWVGVSAFVWRYPDYVNDHPAQFDWYHGEIAPVLQAHGHNVVALLAAGRLLMAIVITLVVLAAFAAARRLVGLRPALAGFLIIALDPFIIAHSRLLHLDGLSSVLMLLALLAFLNYLYQGGRPVDVVVSGAAAGLAGLTRSPALFLAPFVGLMVAAEWWALRRRADARAWPWVLRTLALWSAAGALTFVLLWPAMWVDPLWTVWRVVRGAVGYAAQGHEDPLYFDGVVVSGDPGLHFYPVSFFWRTTPLVLAGLVLLAVAWAHRRGRSGLTGFGPFAWLLVFVALFTAFMSLGSKKFDRYLLPVYLPLDLLAGLGWAATLGWVGTRRPAGLARGGSAAVFGLALAVQAASAAAAHPYYLTYYNSLLGGTRAAPRVMMVGWGEGLDQAAAYLNAQPDSASLRVLTGVWRGTFAYFFNGETIDTSFAPGTLTLAEWQSADYVVVYINQLQRHQLPRPLLSYLQSRAPAFTVRLQGLDYAFVYDIRHQAPPDYLLEQASTPD